MNDESKTLILIDEKDRTKNIKTYERDKGRINILFTNKDQFYSYSESRVLILEEPKEINIDKFCIYYDGKPILKIKTALLFDDYLKVFLKDAQTRVYEMKKIEFIAKDNQGINQNILEYFKDISQYLKDDDKKDKDISENNNYKKTFLESQYDYLEPVLEESVLNTYLKHKDLEKRNIDVDKLIFPFSFNTSQKEAIKTVLEKNIGIIEGPPGTGKTQTILNILTNLAIMENKTIAVVSNNNEATKNVYDKMAKAGYEFLIANLGRYEKRQEFFENLPNIPNFKTEDNIDELIRENDTLNKKMDYLLKRAKEKAQLEKKLEDYILEQKYFDSYLEKQNIEDIIIPLDFDENKSLEIITKLQLIYNKTFFLKPFLLFYYSRKYKLSNLNKKRLNYLLKLQKEFYVLKINNLKDELEKIDNELTNAKFDEIKEQHEEVSRKILNYKLNERYQNTTRDFTYDNYLEKFSEFIKSFPIVLSTTHSIRNSIPANFLFDYLIIDESSQVDLVAGGLALSICKNVIVVGDEKQLPQIVNDYIKENLINPNVPLEYDYFTNNILSSIYKLYKDVPKKTLVEHYRCHPKIIEFSNKRYYNGELISYASIEHKLVDKPLILYYTVPGHHMKKITNGAKGTFNQRELNIIKKEVLNNVHLENYEDKDIGITTPYRLQADLLGKNNESIKSETIHKFQGQEKKLMILSTVLDDSYNGKKSLGFVDDARMINVAVSRAIDRFILVTHNDMFKKNGHEINALLKYMQYESMDAEIINSKLVSVFDLLYKDYSEVLNELNNNLLQRLKYKSENIIDTILYNEMQKKEYRDYSYAYQVFLKNQFQDLTIFTEKEQRFINNLSSFDFVIYETMNKKPVLIIEVDGFRFHDNNPIQLKRDKIKNGICEKVNIPLIRLKTHHTYSEEDIREKIRKAILG